MPNFKNKNARAATAAFAVRESRLCSQLSVSKDDLRALRIEYLTQGQHWDYFSKRVLLTELGAQILRGLVRLGRPESLRPPAVDCVPATRPVVGLLLEKNPRPTPFTGELLAWAMPSHNPKLLVCYLPGTDPANPNNLVSCFVRANVNFLRGMKLPGPGRTVLQVDETLFELSGACPRYRGRW